MKHVYIHGVIVMGKNEGKKTENEGEGRMREGQESGRNESHGS